MKDGGPSRGGRKEAWDIPEIREGQRDGVRYAVRLIGRGLLSHLSYSRLDRHLAHATMAHPRWKGRERKRDSRKFLHANPFFLL